MGPAGYADHAEDALSPTQRVLSWKLLLRRRVTGGGKLCTALVSRLTTRPSAMLMSQKAVKYATFRSEHFRDTAWARNRF
jgi:hypothetical protein